MNLLRSPAIMPIDRQYAALLARIKPYQSKRRSESAAFLIWYLVNYYRLDELEATDCVCDQAGDKGVDGIYVNEGAGTIDVFQSKISQRAASRIGDKPLREFAGTLTQFRSPDALENLIDAAGAGQAGALIRCESARLQIQPPDSGAAAERVPEILPRQLCAGHHARRTDRERGDDFQ